MTASRKHAAGCRCWAASSRNRMLASASRGIPYTRPCRCTHPVYFWGQIKGGNALEARRHGKAYIAVVERDAVLGLGMAQRSRCEQQRLGPARTHNRRIDPFSGGRRVRGTQTQHRPCLQRIRHGFLGVQHPQLVHGVGVAKVGRLLQQPRDLSETRIGWRRWRERVSA